MNKTTYSITTIILILSITVNLLAAAGTTNTKTQLSQTGLAAGTFLSHWGRFQAFQILQIPPPQSLIKLMFSSLNSLEKEISQYPELAKLLNDRFKSLTSFLNYNLNQRVNERKPHYYFLFEDKTNFSDNGGKIFTISPPNSKKKYSYLVLKEVKDFVKIPTDSQSEDGGSLTVELWLKPAVQSEGKVLQSSNWALAVSGSTLVLNISSEKTGEDVKVSADDFPRDIWSQVAIVSCTDGVKLFVNGNLKGSKERQGPLELGETITIGKGYTGFVDELKIYFEQLHFTTLGFTKPIDYLIGEPIINWFQKQSLESGEMWHLFSGLVVSALNAKGDTETVKPSDLNQSIRIMSGKQPQMPQPPTTLPQNVKKALHTLETLAEKSEFSPEDSQLLSTQLKILTGYLNEG